MNSKILKLLSFFCFAVLCFGQQAYATCGTATSNPPSPTPPSWDNRLCTTSSESFGAGTPTRSGNNWIWYCGGVYCSAPWGQPGTCNATYNGQTLVSLPGDTSTLCSNGTTYSALAASFDHNWNWQCLGLNGAANTTCWAEQNLCGSANGGSYPSAPGSGLCAAGGNASLVSSTPDKYLWTCSSATTSNSSYICTANRTVSTTTACGSDHGTSLRTVPTNLCTSGITASAVTTNSNTYTWSCYNWQAVGPTENWRAVAMSSDGHYQTAVAGAQGTPCTGNIYVSTDYGANWTAKAPVVGVWTDVAMSSDGHYQTAVPFDGPTYNSRIQLYVSSDYGNSWSPKGLVKAWTNVIMSSTGQIQVATADNSYTYISNDYGQSWNAATLPTSTWERQLGMSSTGQYISVPFTAGDYMNISSDYGATWASRGRYAGNLNWAWGSAAISSSGRYMTAGTVAETYYTSSDYGVSWTSRGQVNGISNFGRAAMSSSGQKQVVGTTTGLYYSNDFGRTWNSGLHTGGAPVMSSTGQYQTAVVLYGRIWRSTNFGGDNTSYCSTNRIIDGACGTAAKTYLSTAGSFGSDTMCSAGNGTTTPGTVTFPTAGNPATWTCGGLNGGNQSGTCTATKNRPAVITNGTLTYSVNISSNVTFTGFSATDADADTLTYAWACTNGGTFTSNTVANPQYIAPSTARTDTCTLLVSDQHELSTSSTVTVTVTTPTAGVCGSANGYRFLTTDTGYAAAGKPQCSLGTSTAPTTFPTGGTPATWYCSNSGVNSPQCSATMNRKAAITNGTTAYSVNTSGNVTFTGFSATDADADTLTYAWACTNGGTFTSNTVANPQYIAPSTARTDTCTLLVSDQHELSASSTVTVTVNATPAGVCGSANGRTFLSTETSYASYPQCSLGTSTAPTTFPTGGTPATWYCSNSGVNSPQCSATMNRKAAITNGTTSYSAVTSATVTFTGFSATDADSDTLTYAWSCTNGGTFNSSTIANPTYIAPATVRTDTCTLSVNDTHETSVSSTVTVNVASPNINGACGTANGRITSTAPTNPPVPNTTPNPLCAVGTASAFTATSPWKWTCAGSGSGTTASCSTTPLPQWQNN